MAAGDSIFPQMSNRANNRICLTHFVSCILLYSVFFITNRVFPSLNGPLGGLVESFVKESFVPLLNRSLLVLLNKNVFFFKRKPCQKQSSSQTRLKSVTLFFFSALVPKWLKSLKTPRRGHFLFFCNHGNRTDGAISAFFKRERSAAIHSSVLPGAASAQLLPNSGVWITGF